MEGHIFDVASFPSISLNALWRFLLLTVRMRHRTRRFSTVCAGFC